MIRRHNQVKWIPQWPDRMEGSKVCGGECHKTLVYIHSTESIINQMESHGATPERVVTRASRNLGAADNDTGHPAKR
jgi:hypothetical protein